MFNKKVKKTNNNPYQNLRLADAQYFTKLDEKIALAQKQNKKEFCEFLIDKKQFDMNYINVKNNNKVGKLGLIPSSLLSILSARDNEKLFDNYKKDTMKIAKQLFDDDMTLQQICATACEFVRLSTANFDRYESETVQKPQSVLCQLLATNAYGLLSFYFGVSNAIDQTEFLAWLINMGLDIKHSLSYAECVIDAYGQPACHIVEFNGKLGVSYINYVGIAKLYLKKIETLTGLCEFIDFTEEIENGRKRALKVLARYVPIKLMIKNRNIEDAIVSMSRIAHKNITDITATELNMLSIFDNKVWKFSSLCELLLYANGAEYEVIPDLFVETQYAFKLKLDNDGKFKIFPNKVIDEEYRLNEPKIYILNKTANKIPNQENISADDDLFNERIESIGSENKGAEFDNLEPMSADDVLNSLNVKFTPKENDGLTFENGTFKFNDDEMNDVFDLSNATQVDFNKAEEEQRMFEQAAGISAQAPQSEPPKRKGFFDLLGEMSEKTKKNKARRLQEEYERLERNHELNSHENLQGNSINQNETLSQLKQNSVIEDYDNDSVSEAISNSAQISTNNQNNYLENDDNYIDTNTNDNTFATNESDVDINDDDNYLINNNYLPSNDISEDLDYAEINNNNIVDFDNDVLENSKNTAENDNNPVDFSNYLDNNENMSSKFTDSSVANNDDALQNSNTLEASENYDEINAINSNFENIENVDEEITGSNAAENDTNNFAEESIYGDIMQFSNYNYYDRTKDDDDENIDEETTEIGIENDNEISKSTIDDSNDKTIQSNIVEEHPQIKDAEEQPLEKQIEAPKSVDKNDIEHLQNSKVDKQPIMEQPTEAPAEVMRKPARAPQGFAPPLPKRKPAPPLPKRKK